MICCEACSFLIHSDSVEFWKLPLCISLKGKKHVYIYCIYIYIADRLVWFMISQRDELRRWIFGTSSP